MWWCVTSASFYPSGKRNVFKLFSIIDKSHKITSRSKENSSNFCWDLEISQNLHFACHMLEHKITKKSCAFSEKHIIICSSYWILLYSCLYNVAVSKIRSPQMNTLTFGFPLNCGRYIASPFILLAITSSYSYHHIWPEKVLSVLLRFPSASGVKMLFFALNSVIEWNRKPLLVQLHFNWKLIRKISTRSIEIDEFSLQQALFKGFWNQNATFLLLLIVEFPNRA